MHAPLALFAYNRLTHLTRTISALSGNELAEDTDLHIFSDGPKTGQEGEVAEVRKYLKTIAGFKQVFIYESPINKGLGASIISGINQLFTIHDRIIVMEDDLVSSPYFLTFMNEGLDRYESEKKVMSIVGYNYPIEASDSTYFLNNADCLGWATWKDRWAHFEPDAGKLLQKISERGLQSRFDMDNSYPYWKLLTKVFQKKNSSWAVRWYASVFLAGGLSLYPKKSLIQHIGNDQGTNMSHSNFLNTPLSAEKIPLADIPLEEDLLARRNLAGYFRKNSTYLGYFRNKLSYYLSLFKR